MFPIRHIAEVARKNRARFVNRLRQVCLSCLMLLLHYVIFKISLINLILCAPQTCFVLHPRERYVRSGTNAFPCGIRLSSSSLLGLLIEKRDRTELNAHTLHNVRNARVRCSVEVVARSATGSIPQIDRDDNGAERAP